MWDTGHAGGTGPRGLPPGSPKMATPGVISGDEAQVAHRKSRKTPEEVTAVGRGRGQRTGQTLEGCVEEPETLRDHQEFAGARDLGSRDGGGGPSHLEDLVPPPLRLGFHGEAETRLSAANISNIS